MQRNYTDADVKGYRDSQGCGILEARAHFEREFFREQIRNAKRYEDIHTLFQIVEELIERTNWRDTYAYRKD